MAIVCKAKLRNNEEQQLVNELNAIATDAGISKLLIRRQATSFGARAKPYKVCQREGLITLDINLGNEMAWHPLRAQSTIQKVKAFVNSNRVQNFIEETA